MKKSVELAQILFWIIFAQKSWNVQQSVIIFESLIRHNCKVIFAILDAFVFSILFTKKSVIVHCAICLKF